MFSFSEGDPSIVNSVRIYPNENDTSGFYIALIKKIKNTKYTSTSKMINDEDSFHSISLKSKKQKKIVGVVYKTAEVHPVEPSIISNFISNYGIAKELITDCMIAHSVEAKKIYYISQKLKDVILVKEYKKLSIIYYGTIIAIKNNKKVENEDEYRISQDGIRLLAPFLGKRLIKIAWNKFVEVLNSSNPIYLNKESQLANDSVSFFSNLGLGSYCISSKYRENDDLEFIVILIIILDIDIK